MRGAKTLGAAIPHCAVLYSTALRLTRPNCICPCRRPRFQKYAYRVLWPAGNRGRSDRWILTPRRVGAQQVNSFNLRLPVFSIPAYRESWLRISLSECGRRCIITVRLVQNMGASSVKGSRAAGSNHSHYSHSMCRGPSFSYRVSPSSYPHHR